MFEYRNRHPEYEPPLPASLLLDLFSIPIKYACTGMMGTADELCLQIVLFVGINVIRGLRVRGNARRVIWSLPALGSVSLIASAIRFGVSYTAARKDVRNVKMKAVHIVRPILRYLFFFSMAANAQARFSLSRGLRSAWHGWHSSYQL